MFKKKRIIDFFFNFIGKLESEYPKNPFGNKPKATKNEYYKLFESIKDLDHPEINQFEKKNGFCIEKNWINELALYTQITIKKSKLNFQHGRVLYSSLRKYIAENKSDKIINIIETGTSKGFSSICMSKALIDSNSLGKILTYDILPHEKRMYWNVFLDNSGKHSRQELLKKWLKELSNIIFIQGSSRTNMIRTHLDRINFAFLDAEHTYKDVISEFKYVSSKQIINDIIVFDDVTPGKFDGVVKALQKIQNENKYDVEYIRSSDQRGYAIAKKIK